MIKFSKSSSIAKHIIQYLYKNNGAAKDREIYEYIKKEIKDINISYSEFLTLLMSLEINGFITVNMINDNLRAVNLIKNIKAGQ